MIQAHKTIQFVPCLFYRTGYATDNVVLLGDFNSYAAEDPITTILNNGYISLVGGPETNDYSYLFDGQAGKLDYVFIKAAAAGSSTATASIWHVNSDELDYLDYNTDFGRDLSIFNASIPERFSDHDPMLVGMDLVALSDKPSASPVASFECVDSPLIMMIGVRPRGCNWAANNPTVRCMKANVAQHCPLTCDSVMNSCSSCEDSNKKFVMKKSKFVKKCAFIGKDEDMINSRCANEGVLETCRVTCGYCEA